MKGLWIVFLSIFIAELGDKTQLATLTFSIDQQISKWGIFAASSLALVLSSLIAVVVGSQLTHWINPKMLKIIAGLGFIGIGIFTLLNIRN
jgi:putative Ca2+/H+ antiporter (TMEM165/GDT1 family)